MNYTMIHGTATVAPCIIVAATVVAADFLNVD